MSKPKIVVDLFYDVISPYSWLGFEILTRYKMRWNIDLRLRPTFLGGIMNLSGNKPPGLVPSKMVYLTRDIIRMSNYYQVPLRHPADPAERMFVLGSLSTMRYITAVGAINKDLVEDLSREFWFKCWNRDENIHLEDNFVEASKKIGMSDAVIQDALTRHKTSEIKDRLKATTQEAFEYGAFGTPTMVAHTAKGDEMLFGSDRIEILAHLLGERWEGPLTELSKCKL